MTLSNLLTEQAAASLAHKIVSSEQVRKHEPKAAELSGCAMFDLMQRAGESAFQLLLKSWPTAKRILVLVGSGNNAGDGFILATLAKQHGLQVDVASLNPERILEGDAKQAQKNWQQAGGSCLAVSKLSFGEYHVLVDALLGTGLQGQVSPSLHELFEKINHARCPVLSLDLPSGMHADTGRAMPVCVQATATITFVAIKPGLITGSAKTFCGQLTLADLAIAEDFFRLVDSPMQWLNYSMLRALPARPLHANKGHFGKVLCIGGNQGMAGAIRISAEAALRTGAGLVKVFCHPNSQAIVAAGRPEIMLTNGSLNAALEWCNCIIFGPGLGQDDWAEQQFSALFEYLRHQPKPLVIDADGLNLLAARKTQENVQTTLAGLSDCVITPHPGEASRLIGIDIADVENDRYQASEKLAAQFSAVAVLKGAGTIIHLAASQDVATSWICQGGNPGMATAGMGDLLTGITGALLGQGLSASQAALYAVCAHAEAGDRVANQLGQRGMMASDLLTPLRALINGR